MYQSISLYAVLGWFALLGACIGLNELCRANKWFSLLMFAGLPAVLTFTLWPHTAGPGTTMGVWFYWVKTYSVMAGCLGFMEWTISTSCDRARCCVSPSAFCFGRQHRCASCCRIGRT